MSKLDEASSVIPLDTDPVCTEPPIMDAFTPDRPTDTTTLAEEDRKPDLALSEAERVAETCTVYTVMLCRVYGSSLK